MKRGFSLLEVLLMLALAGILLYAGSYAFLNLAPKYRLNRATWEIQTRLNYARYKAIFEGRDVRVSFRPRGYTVEKYDNMLKVWKVDASGSFEGVTVEANNRPTFHPLGTVSNLATITVLNSWGGFRITLAISGRIRVTKI
jgi:prepilin-type N-terminal cleavage/methylation domain-containing protein